MPNCCSLQIHFFAVPERVAAFGAASARRMEVVVVAGLENLSTDVALAISALNSEGLLVILLTVGLAIFAHVLATQNRSAHEAPKMSMKQVWIWRQNEKNSFYLKHQMCHCLSKAIRAWPSFSSAPHPAQLFGSISFGLVGFWRISLCCCCAVAFVGLACCWVIVFCLTVPPPTHFSHRISFPVFVTFRKIVYVKKNVH